MWDLKVFLDRNEQIIKHVIGIVTGVLIGMLITWFGIVFFQPNIEYEKCPTYNVNAPLMKSVSCILLKNTGYAPAYDVKLTIKTDFFQQYNTIEPEEIMCDGCMKVNEKKAIYSFNNFAKGAKALIYIPAPGEDAKIGISGIYKWGDSNKRRHKHYSKYSNEPIDNWCLLFNLLRFRFTELLYSFQKSSYTERDNRRI